MPPEAEVVSGHHQCVLRELVFARGHVLWHVLPRDYVVLHEDKQAMIRVVRVCRDPTLRYVLAQDPQELNGICVRSVCRCDGDQQTSKTWGQQDFMIWRQVCWHSLAFHLEQSRHAVAVCVNYGSTHVAHFIRIASSAANARASDHHAAGLLCKGSCSGGED